MEGYMEGMGRGGAVTPDPHLYCKDTKSVIGRSSALATKKNWTFGKGFGFVPVEK